MLLNCKTGYLERLKTKWDLQVGPVNSEIHHCGIIRKLTAKTFLPKQIYDRLENNMLNPKFDE